MDKHRFAPLLSYLAPSFLAASILFFPVHASASVLKVLIDSFGSFLSAELSKEATIEMAVEKQAADQKVVQDYKNRVNEVDRKLNKQNNTNICNSMAVVNAQKLAVQVARASVIKSIEKSSLRASSTVNSESDSVLSYDNAMSKYCTQTDISTGNCRRSGTQVDTMAGADMHATTLFSAIGSDDPSDTYADPAQEVAADEFIRRVASPSPPEMLTKSCFTPQCKSYEDYRRSYLAINSIAVNSLNEVKSSHLPSSVSASTASNAPVNVSDSSNYIQKSSFSSLYSYISSKISPDSIKSTGTRIYTASVLSATHSAASRWLNPSAENNQRSEKKYTFSN